MADRSGSEMTEDRDDDYSRWLKLNPAPDVRFDHDMAAWQTRRIQRLKW